MKHLLTILLLLAACGRGDPPTGNEAEPAADGAGAESAPRRAVEEARLTGLYEGGAGAQKNQLCIVEKGREAQFGLLVWGGNLHSCSGAGQAVRSGERLTLRMTGDEACTIEAALKDGVVTLPATPSATEIGDRHQLMPALCRLESMSDPIKAFLTLT